MKQNILSPRSHVVMAIIITLGILFGTQTASAKRTYTLTGDKIVTLTKPSNGWISWKITSLIPDTLHLYINITNYESALSITPTNKLDIFTDSNGQKIGQIFANYIGGSSRSGTSVIYITDFKETSDSIFINFKDDTFDPPILFDLYADDIKGTSYSETFFYHGDKPFTLPLKLRNDNGSPRDFKLSLENSTGAFTLDNSSVTVAGNTTKIINLTFEKGNSYMDSVSVVATAPNGKRDIVKVIAMDSSMAISNYVPNDTLYFLDQTIGTTKCGYLHIRNPNNFPITITTASWVGNGTNFKINTKISLPKIIAANSSDSVEICFTAPDIYGIVDVYELHLEYSAVGRKISASYCAAIASTKACFTINSKIPSIFNNNMAFESTIVGGYTDMNVTFTNNTDREITVTDVFHRPSNGKGSDFITIVSPTSFPVKIASGKEFDMTMRFAPTQDIYMMGFTWGLHLLAGSDSLCNLSETYYGYGYILNGNDTDAHTLFPSQLEVLPMKSEQNTSSKIFRFVNNGQTNVKVSGLSLRDGKHFSITSPKQSDLPITVNVGDHLDVELTFDANSNGFYTDSLIIVTDKALTSIPYHIQAVRTGVASVKSSSSDPVSITIVPNPATTTTIIHASGITTTSMEIFDVLGNSIATHSGSEWQFNTSESTRSLSAGSYFVRVSGFDSNGNPIVQTKRLVIR